MPTAIMRNIRAFALLFPEGTKRILAVDPFSQQTSTLWRRSESNGSVIGDWTLAEDEGGGVQAFLLDGTGIDKGQPTSLQFRQALNDLNKSSEETGGRAILIAVVCTGRLGRRKFLRAITNEGWEICDQFTVFMTRDEPSRIISNEPTLQMRELQRILPHAGRLKRIAYRILEKVGLWPSIEKHHLYRAQRSAAF